MGQWFRETSRIEGRRPMTSSERDIEGASASLCDRQGKSCWTCPARWLLEQVFDKDDKHFVKRKGKPGFHWDNHQNRIEVDKDHGWHFNDASKPNSHRAVGRGLLNLAGKGLLNAGRLVVTGAKAISRGIGNNTSLIPLCTVEVCTSRFSDDEGQRMA
jgi:hypothetical protein